MSVIKYIAAKVSFRAFHRYKKFAKVTGRDMSTLTRDCIEDAMRRHEEAEAMRGLGSRKH